MPNFTSIIHKIIYVLDDMVHEKQIQKYNAWLSETREHRCTRPCTAHMSDSNNISREFILYQALC